MSLKIEEILNIWVTCTDKQVEERPANKGFGR
jgi:hypothetical protein